MSYLYNITHLCLSGRQSIILLVQENKNVYQIPLHNNTVVVEVMKSRKYQVSTV